VVDGFTYRFMVVVCGWWLMVDGLSSLQGLSMNILPKLTDGLNHSMVSGWWLMLFFLLFSAAKTVSILLSDGLNHPLVYGWWLMVDGLWFMFTVEVMVNGLYVVDGYMVDGFWVNGLPLKVYSWRFMVDG
jgi:hypothetical protein